MLGMLVMLVMLVILLLTGSILACGGKKQSRLDSRGLHDYRNWYFWIDHGHHQDYPHRAVVSEIAADLVLLVDHCQFGSYPVLREGGAFANLWLWATVLKGRKCVDMRKCVSRTRRP
jgi:hypothetical protein